MTKQEILKHVVLTQTRLARDGPKGRDPLLKELYEDSWDGLLSLWKLLQRQGVIGADEDYERYGLGWTPLTAIVPLKRDNGHDYELGKVAIQTHAAEKMFFKEDGRLGNYMTTNEGSWRYATDEEINQCTWRMTNGLKETLRRTLEDYPERYPGMSLPIAL